MDVHVAMEIAPLILRMERGPSEGRSFPATHLKRVTVGRTRTNNYQIKDPTVSQKHAIIEWSLGHWTLVDIGSSNGTDVNGKVLDENQPVRLENGDLIRFGEAINVRVQIQEKDDIEQDEEETEHVVTVEEWFEQERRRIVQSVCTRADTTILEMKQGAEQLRQMFREHAGVE